jgi:hypothetical protein
MIFGALDRLPTQSGTLPPETGASFQPVGNTNVFPRL